MLLKPLLKNEMQSIGRKQSEEIIISDLCREYLLPPLRLGSLKLLTSPEEDLLKDILHFFFLLKFYHSPQSTVSTSGFSGAPWRPPKHFQNEHTFIAAFEKEKTGRADLIRP